MIHVSFTVLTLRLTLINAGVRGLVAPRRRCFPHLLLFTIGRGMEHCGTVALMARERKIEEVSSTFTSAALLNADSVLIREHNMVCTLPLQFMAQSFSTVSPNMKDNIEWNSHRFFHLNSSPAHVN